MLKILLGRKQTGKTYSLIKTAEESAIEGKKVIMLVPEQYSFECQRMLLKKLGHIVSNKIEIHSFTSICQALAGVYGGVSGRAVDEGTRFILTRRAIEGVKDSLLHYTDYTSSPEFVKKILSVIKELKQSSVNEGELLEFSKTVESEIFSGKLHDISVIMSAYNALLEDAFIEPLDLIEKTVDRLPDNSYFADKVVIVDEFKGFTEAQFALLDRIIAANGETHVSLCCDSVIPINDTDIFSNVKATANRLVSIAASHGVKSELLKTEYCGIQSKSVIALESFLAQSTDEGISDASDILVCKAKAVYDEVEFCMTNIRRLVRENGYRYKDFVIISRNADVYNSIIGNVAEGYNIPCFTDSRVSVASLPLSVFVLSAIKAAESFNTENILRYLKTGLSGVDFDEIADIENYVYIWSISGRKWLEDWDMNTQGLKVGDDSDKLTKLNDARKRAVLPLIALKNKLKGNAEDMCRAIVQLFDDCDTLEFLKKYADRLSASGKPDQARLQSAGYDIFIKTLDKIAAVMGDQALSVSDFVQILSSSLAFETVGEIPQTKDQVMYGTADRIRPMRPKVVFILGANQDVFPQSVNDVGVFSLTERERLIDCGFAVSDCHINVLLEEKFLFYSSCCCASHKVFISYCETLSDGSATEPSSIVNSIVKAFPDCKQVRYGYDDGVMLNDIESVVSGFEKLSENFTDSGEIISGLKQYFCDKPKYKDKLKAIEEFLSGVGSRLSKDSAKLLYGDSLSLSASKIDDFNGCRFMYFCKYGLGAKTLNKVDFDALTRGNIVHYCLEQFVNAHKEDIGTLDEKAIGEECAALCDEYIGLFATDVSILGEKFGYMLALLKETATLVAVALNNEFAQSRFKPRYCELKVGDGEPLSSIDVCTDEGCRVSLRGSIDRVDTTDDGKVRVVDYKTGVKEFKLSAVLSGMNMQMLLYLYAAVKNGAELLKANVPAGILYFPARRNITDDSPEKYIKMNGLIDGDLETVRQMEEKCEGKIVPAKLRPNGSSFYSTESTVTQDGFKTIFKYLDIALKQIGEAIMNGDITALPLKTGQVVKCDHCDYKAICKLSNDGDFKEVAKHKTAQTLEIMENEVKEEE